MSSTRQTIKHLNITFDHPGNHYTHAYTTNAALTLFKKDEGDLPQRADNAIPRKLFDCIESLRFGREFFSDHDEHYHQSLEDKHLSHTHFIKLNKNLTEYERITPDELTCMLEKFAAIERENDLCTDSNNQCIMAPADAEKLKLAYHDYYEQAKKAGLPNIPANTKASIDALAHTFRTSAWNSFCFSFINTLLDHYALPAMQEAGYSALSQKALKSLLFTLLKFMLFNSFADLPLTLGFELVDYMIGRALSLNNQTSLNRTFIYNLIYVVHAYVHTSDHIMSALAGGAGGAAGGTQLGHTIVAALPKLKKEPVAENQPETTTIKQPVSAGLRHRGPRH